MSDAGRLGQGALLAAFAVSLAAAQPQTARAYSDFKQFAYPSNGGGGGGRFYTGSPADGYTCRICHEGGPAPEVRVHGLPLDGYRPGVEYEITVDWWDGDALSTAIELTDSEGRPAGSVRLPPESSVENPERCKQSKDDVIAATLVSVPPPKHRSELKYFDMCTQAQRDRPEDCRQVISVPACGSGRVRFAWKAPNFDLGPIWFSGAVVNSNNDENTTGDGVAEIGTLLPSPSEVDAGVRTYAGCGVLEPVPRASLSVAFAGMLSAVAAFCVRARARARARVRVRVHTRA